MKKIISAILLTLSAQTLCASSIAGHISPSKEWSDYIYISEVKKYEAIVSGSSAFVTDSLGLDERGNFSFKQLKPNTIYRISVAPKEMPGGMIINDGHHDNYAFVITGEEDSEIRLKGDISRLFLSYTLSSATPELAALNNKILHIRTIIMPVFDKLQHVDLEPLKTIKDENEATAYRIKLMKEIQTVSISTNKLLFSFLEQESSPDLLSIGAGLSRIEKARKEDVASIAAHMAEVYNNTGSPVLKSVVEMLEQNKNVIRPDFLYERSYRLMTGQNFNFLNPRIPSRFILLDLWASWCTPCRKSIKTDLRLIKSKYTPQQLQIIGIVVNDKFQAAEKAIRDDKNPALQIFDEDRFLDKYFNNPTIPYYVLINQETQEILPFSAFIDVEAYLSENLK